MSIYGAKNRIPLEVSLPILVFIDMFAVALVVPLLFQYYKKAGVTSSTQRELLSSVFSASQIIGGLLLGALTDAKFLRKKTVLFMSFGGSAIAYLMIAYGGFTALILSRILVGLIKQTMTISYSMLSACTAPETRSRNVGRIQSSSTAAWILGPSTGALLFKYVDHRAPVCVASLLFVLNMMLAAVLLSGSVEKNACLVEPNSEDMCMNEKKQSDYGSKRSFWENLKSCYSSESLISVVASQLIFYWMNRATSYSSMGSYYEDMYGVEPHVRGYIQSYQRALEFIIQSSLIRSVLERVGGERRAVFLSCILLAGATIFEARQNLSIFLLAISPSIALSRTMISVSLRSLLTQLAPADAIFSIFAALDVLQNVSAVSIPFYRTFLFRLMTNVGAGQTLIVDDPDPISWIVSSSFHWVIAAIGVAYLLRPEHNVSLRLSHKKKSL